MLGLIYLAIPYNHPYPKVRLQRFEIACRAAAILINQGYLIFSPISHSHPIACIGNLPLGFDYWERYDWTLLRRCDCLAVLMINGWKESIGVKREIEIMKELCKPIHFLQPIFEADRFELDLIDIKIQAAV